MISLTASSSCSLYASHATSDFVLSRIIERKSKKRDRWELGRCSSSNSKYAVKFGALIRGEGLYEAISISDYYRNVSSR